MKEYKYIIPLTPITKKNHQQIKRRGKNGPLYVAPSPQYMQYSVDATWFLHPAPDDPIDYPVNVKCLFFMPDLRRVDKTNLEESIHDILVNCDILKDDNCKIVAATDGTRVLLDRENPRTEIYISPMKEDGEEKEAAEKLPVDVLRDLFKAFPHAFINHIMEFVAEPNRRVNSYFSLENCRTRNDFTCKVLEWLSREACCSCHYQTERKNNEVYLYHLNGINNFCGTEFDLGDMEDIYRYLGNAINHEKTERFIESNFNMNILTEE